MISSRGREVRHSTEILAEYLFEQRFETFPEEVLRKAKLCILDSLGCIVGGAQIEPGRTVISLMEKLHGGGSSTILTSPKKVSLWGASYANSYLANVMDYDDIYPTLGHPGAAIIGIALAVGEKENSSGEEFLTAVITAYEICLRVAGAILGSPDHKKLVHGQGALASFGAASVAAKLLKLTPKKIANCFGLAGPHTLVPFERKVTRPRPVSWIKNNFGWAALGGLMAVMLAEEGITGNLTVLDGENGFWRMFASDRCVFPFMTGGLGKEFLIERVCFKLYPACWLMHSSLQALCQILLSKHVRAGEIRCLSVYSSKKIRDYLHYNPKTVMDLPFSLPYQFAMMVLGKRCREWLRAENLKDPRIHEMAQKVAFAHNESADRAYYEASIVSSTVKLKTGSGKDLCATVSQPTGSAGNPLSSGFLEKKFLDLAQSAVGGNAIQARDLILHLEEVKSIRDLIRLLVCLREEHACVKEEHDRSKRKKEEQEDENCRRNPAS